MYIKPNVPNLPILLPNLCKGLFANVVVIPAASPMSAQGVGQWCVHAETSTEAAHDITMPLCVHEGRGVVKHFV